jgi:N-hydroxyarylamine O-acetyltransferase
MTGFDMDAYLSRIGYEGALLADLETLRGLQFAHRCTVPFENLDIHLGVPLSLDIGHLFAKIVDRRRGGYCFEQNTLFLHVLREAGFKVTPREARVGPADGPTRPRSHMTLEVPIEGIAYNVDVGFGGDSALRPVAIDGESHAEVGREYRLVVQGGHRILRIKRGETWSDSYVIQPSEPAPIDFEVANWYTSTHPDSKFVQTPTAQLSRPSGQSALRRRTYTESEDGVETTRELSDAEIGPLLRDVFGIDLGEDVHRVDFDGRGAA